MQLKKAFVKDKAIFISRLATTLALLIFDFTSILK